MDKKIKTWSLRFPAKENPNMEKALLDWPIVLQYDVKAKYRLISRKFSGMNYFYPSVTRVCIRSINQSNRSISVRLLFLFCSHVFISRSYENCSIPDTCGFCFAPKLYHTGFLFIHKNRDFVMISVTKLHWSQKWSITNWIGSMLHFGAVWTSILSITEVNETSIKNDWNPLRRKQISRSEDWDLVQ